MPEDNEKVEVYTLTKNVVNRSKFLGMEKRNLVEAIIFTALVLYIVNVAIPFTPLVKIICSLVLGIFTFALNIIGIKKRSLTEILVAEIKFRQNRRRLHLRGPEYVRKRVISNYTESEDESLAERYFKLAKEYIDGFVERYGEEEDSQGN